jgi:hypothetical protein
MNFYKSSMLGVEVSPADAQRIWGCVLVLISTSNCTSQFLSSAATHKEVAGSIGGSNTLPSAVA